MSWLNLEVKPAPHAHSCGASKYSKAKEPHNTQVSKASSPKGCPERNSSSGLRRGSPAFMPLCLTRREEEIPLGTVSSDGVSRIMSQHHSAATVLQNPHAWTVRAKEIGLDGVNRAVVPLPSRLAGVFQP